MLRRQPLLGRRAKPAVLCVADGSGKLDYAALVPGDGAFGAIYVKGVHVFGEEHEALEAQAKQAVMDFLYVLRGDDAAEVVEFDGDLRDLPQGFVRRAVEHFRLGAFDIDFEKVDGADSLGRQKGGEL